MDGGETTLYGILKSLIEGGEFDHRDEKDLIETAKLRYLKEGPRGQIPNPVTADFTESLEIELRDMIKAITYGHFDLKNYNLNRRK